MSRSCWFQNVAFPRARLTKNSDETLTIWIIKCDKCSEEEEPLLSLLVLFRVFGFTPQTCGGCLFYFLRPRCPVSAGCLMKSSLPTMPKGLIPHMLRVLPYFSATR